MKLTRRLALGHASGFAVAGAALVPAAASTSSDPKSGAAAPTWPVIKTAQWFTTVAITGADANQTSYAPVAIRSPQTLWVSQGQLDAVAYEKAQNEYRSRGYRLRRVNAFQTEEGVKYAAIWQHGAGAQQQAFHDMSLAQFQSKSSQLGGRDYHVSHIDVATTVAGPRYAAIWDHGAAPAQQVDARLTAREYEEKLGAMTAQGFRVRQISSYLLDGQPHFAAIFDKGPVRDWHAQHQMTAAVFQRKSAAFAAQGYLPVDVSGYIADGKPVFSGVWEKA